MARKTPPQASEENTIEPAALQERQPDLLKSNSAAPRNKEVAGAAASIGTDKASAAADSRAVPAAVRERFLQIGEKFLFPSGDPAFRDLGRKLTTRSENAEVVRSLIEIAQTRGWSEIQVSGTTAFRRAIWQEATLAHLTVKGFTPKELDEAQLARRMARRREAHEDRAKETEPSRQAPSERAAEATAAEQDRADKNSRPAVLTGTLIAHGPENYKLDPHADMSYFVKLKTDEGRETVVWGLDLERALKDSKTQPRLGDRIGILHRGEKTVTVVKREHDAEGRVLSERPVKTHRNDWLVETASFFQERARLAETVRNPSIEARRAAERHPELAGTYVALKGSELYAERHIPDAHDRKRFMALLRQTLAQQIEQGEALYAPAMRERSRDSDSRAPLQARPAPEISPAR